MKKINKIGPHSIYIHYSSSIGSLHVGHIKINHMIYTIRQMQIYFCFMQVNNYKTLRIVLVKLGALGSP